MTGPLPTRLGWPVWRIALVIVVGAFLSMLDGSIVAVGLHTIGHDLHAGLDEVQWVLTAYLIALAVSLPACGWLGRRVGVGGSGSPRSPRSPPDPRCAPSPRGWAG